MLSLPLGWTASSALSGWSTTLQSHLTWFPTQLSHGSLGQAVVLGLPPPSGYVITQKLPAVPQPHTEFPNKTCENSCDGNSGHCWQPRAGAERTGRLLRPAAPDVNGAYMDTVFGTYPGKDLPGKSEVPRCSFDSVQTKWSRNVFCPLSSGLRLLSLQSWGRRKALWVYKPHLGGVCMLITCLYEDHGVHVGSSCLPVRLPWSRHFRLCTWQQACYLHASTLLHFLPCCWHSGCDSLTVFFPSFWSILLPPYLSKVKVLGNTIHLFKTWGQRAYLRMPWCLVPALRPSLKDPGLRKLGQLKFVLPTPNADECL